MSDVISVITQLAAVTFVLTSMFGMGLSLIVPEMIDPLRDARPRPPSPG